MSTQTCQAKELEIDFFDRHASQASEYNVFSERTNQRLVGECVERCRLAPGSNLLDLGCGSGIFSHYLARHGLKMTAADLSPRLVAVGREMYPEVSFHVEDAEALSFADGAFDGVFLGGVIHHFPDPSKMAREVARVLRPGGAFYAFDPNRCNPCMYLYRDRSSPFYSPVGVTPNERPVLAAKVARVFTDAGLVVATDYVSVSYRYVASSRVRWLLPMYNLAESVLFAPAPLKRFRAFVLTWGTKQ